ncbi:MAG: DNA alkylation repair protein [Ruminococcus sp.]|nr:DNA alkylation repair protein [Candidatus Apopatosoma intestinale]
MNAGEIEALLYEKKDPAYRLFQARLMPGTDPERILGVRTPDLRKLAKELAKRDDVDEFLADLPHRYYDENNLHGFIISECKDYQKTVGYVDAILPYVDNWATCDLLSPKVFRKHKAELLSEIDRWIASDRVYTVRFGIEMLMSHYLDEDFRPEYLDKVVAIRSDEYYVNMMIAWFFATALTKQWANTVPVLEEERLSIWVHNKTIQKACESYRISEEQKGWLKTRKR